MQTAAQAASASLTALRASTPSTTGANPPPSTPSHVSSAVDAGHLRRLWERMLAMYDHAWHSAHGPSPQDDAGRMTVSGDTWAKALAGITGDQLAAGLRACVAEGGEFPPSAPRFRGMCLGIPSFSEINRQLITDTQRSPFARLVWQHVDAYAHRHASARDAERMRRAAYELASEAVMRGEPLPGEPVAVIEQAKPRKPQGIPKTPEARREHLRKLLAGVDL